MKNSAEFEELEKASRTGLTRDQLEERRDKVIEKYNMDPNHLATVKDLAGIYEQLEDWHNAHTFYSWAHSLSNGDVALATASLPRCRWCLRCARVQPIYTFAVSFIMKQ